MSKDFLELEPSVGRIFAIGDIHGCRAELGLLLTHLTQTLGFASDDQLIFIGDYIDRGPDSRGVIEDLLSFRESFPDNTFFLRGNHEEMFLAYVDELESQMSRSYIVNGGMSCLQSYDVANPYKPEHVREKLPAAHRTFLDQTLRYIICGEWVFAHAGVNPLRDLRFQLDEDLYWIRDEFIGNMHHFQKTIVFGHTPFEDILFHLPYKVGIDTGCVYGNALTCIDLKNEASFQVDFGGRKVREATWTDKGASWPKI